MYPLSSNHRFSEPRPPRRLRLSFMRNPLKATPSSCFSCANGKRGMRCDAMRADHSNKNNSNNPTAAIPQTPPPLPSSTCGTPLRRRRSRRTPFPEGGGKVVPAVIVRVTEGLHTAFDALCGTPPSILKVRGSVGLVRKRASRRSRTPRTSALSSFCARVGTLGAHFARVCEDCFPCFSSLGVERLGTQRPGTQDKQHNNACANGGCPYRCFPRQTPPLKGTPPPVVLGSTLQQPPLHADHWPLFLVTVHHCCLIKKNSAHFSIGLANAAFAKRPPFPSPLCVQTLARTAPPPHTRRQHLCVAFASRVCFVCYKKKETKKKKQKGKSTNYKKSN